MAPAQLALAPRPRSEPRPGRVPIDVGSMLKPEVVRLNPNRRPKPETEHLARGNRARLPSRRARAPLRQANSAARRLRKSTRTAALNIRTDATSTAPSATTIRRSASIRTMSKPTRRGAREEAQSATGIVRLRSVRATRSIRPGRPKVGGAREDRFERKMTGLR
jgi:hypothetical protein